MSLVVSQFKNASICRLSKFSQRARTNRKVPRGAFENVPFIVIFIEKGLSNLNIDKLEIKVPTRVD